MFMKFKAGLFPRSFSFRSEVIRDQPCFASLSEAGSGKGSEGSRLILDWRFS